MYPTYTRTAAPILLNPDSDGDQAGIAPTQTATVFVVDDEPTVRDSVSMLLRSAGFVVEAFETADAFLRSYDPATPGCLLLDVRLPGISGMELQKQLIAQGIRLPIIILTGHGDVQMAVSAMKRGAMDFIEKPFVPAALLERVRHALDTDWRAREDAKIEGTIRARIEMLTRREKQVMELVVRGFPNKGIAAELGVTAKTVEAHRAHVMRKMETNSLPDLVRYCHICGV